MSAFIKGSGHKHLNTWFLSFCTYYISVSENCRQDLISLYPRVALVSETITIGTYKFNEVTPASTPEEGPVLINVGGMVPEKNHDFLLEIFLNLKKQLPDCKLWLVGEGKTREALENKIIKNDIQEDVKFWGNRPDVISLMKAAHVMVMPSRIEGLPGVILEAMSCGLPVAATPVGGIPEVIKDRETGLILSLDNPKQNAEALLRLISSPELLKDITNSAAKMVQEQFLMPNIAQKFIKTYQGVEQLK